jgi:glycosyltransferase involved in cell wall biosynthesis
MKDQFSLVSVLMTAYNRAAYIADSIQSVLASTYENFELIIVDDCSSDNTFEIARSYEKMDKRIKVYINDANIGDYPNRNKAASYANGKYIKYLDSDDILYPHSLKIMVTAMNQFPEAGYGLSAISDSSNPYPMCISPRAAYLEHFSQFGHFGRAPGSSIILREAFEKVGGFSGRRMIGDSELWFTLSRYFPLVKMPRDLVWDRQHSGQESKSDYAKKYDILNKALLNQALSHPDCPLTKQEINSILKKERYRTIKKIIMKWL